MQALQHGDGFGHGWDRPPRVIAHLTAADGVPFRIGHLERLAPHLVPRWHAGAAIDPSTAASLQRAELLAAHSGQGRDDDRTGRCEMLNEVVDLVVVDDIGPWPTVQTPIDPAFDRGAEFSFNFNATRDSVYPNGA